MRSITRGCASRNRSTSGRGITRQLEHALGDDVRRRGALGQDRDLTEEVAAAETCDLLRSGRPLPRRGPRRGCCRRPPVADAATRERLLVELMRDGVSSSGSPRATVGGAGPGRSLSPAGRSSSPSSLSHAAASWRTARRCRCDDARTRLEVERRVVEGRRVEEVDGEPASRTSSWPRRCRPSAPA